MIAQLLLSWPKLTLDVDEVSSPLLQLEQRQQNKFTSNF